MTRPAGSVHVAARSTLTHTHTVARGDTRGRAGQAQRLARECSATARRTVGEPDGRRGGRRRHRHHCSIVHVEEQASRTGQRHARGAEADRNLTPWRRRLMARSLAFVYLTGPTLVIAWLVLPRSNNDEEQMMAVSIAAFAIGILLLDSAERPAPLGPEGHGRATPGAAGQPLPRRARPQLGALYIWTTAYAYCFFSRDEQAHRRRRAWRDRATCRSGRPGSRRRR